MVSYQEYVVGFMVGPRPDVRSEVLISRDVVMIQKNRPAWQAGTWNGVGGKIIGSETAGEAMVREFLEETGVKTKLTDWRLRVKLDGHEAGYVVYFYIARPETLPNIQSTTDEPVSILSIKSVLDGTYPTVGNMRWILPLCCDRSVCEPVEVKCC